MKGGREGEREREGAGAGGVTGREKKTQSIDERRLEFADGDFHGSTGARLGRTEGGWEGGREGGEVRVVTVVLVSYRLTISLPPDAR